MYLSTLFLHSVKIQIQYIENRHYTIVKIRYNKIYDAYTVFYKIRDLQFHEKEHFL